jgi:hypothetical protein
MEFVSNVAVTKLIDAYPQLASSKLYQLRNLIIEVAEETDGLTKLLETSKWGEPSYLTKYGSTIRIDWKEKTPDKYYLFFICSTELVSTFKIIFGEELDFEDNRAISLNLHEPIPIEAIKRCLSLALNYKKIKHLPMLGA